MWQFNIGFFYNWKGLSWQQVSKTSSPFNSPGFSLAFLGFSNISLLLFFPHHLGKGANFPGAISNFPVQWPIGSPFLHGLGVSAGALVSWMGSPPGVRGWDSSRTLGDPPLYTKMGAPKKFFLQEAGLFLSKQGFLGASRVLGVQSPQGFFGLPLPPFFCFRRVIPTQGLELRPLYKKNGAPIIPLRTRGVFTTLQTQALGGPSQNRGDHLRVILHPGGV